MVNMQEKDCENARIVILLMQWILVRKNRPKPTEEDWAFKYWATKIYYPS